MRSALHAVSDDAYVNYKKLGVVHTFKFNCI